jgi:CheY-like chemotaxis protein
VRSRTILLVEDEAETRAVIAAALDDDYTVLQAETGYEAVGVLTENWVDLLLTDVRMPGIDGFELARQANPIYSPPMLLSASERGSW